MPLFLLSDLIIPCRFCSLYGRKNKRFSKIRCIVDIDILRSGLASLILRRALFSDKHRKLSIDSPRIRGLLLPPPCDKFSVANNCQFQFRILFRVGDLLFIVVCAHPHVIVM